MELDRGRERRRAGGVLGHLASGQVRRV